MLMKFYEQMGFSPADQIVINSGDAECRPAYREESSSSFLIHKDYWECVKTVLSVRIHFVAFDCK